MKVSQSRSVRIIGALVLPLVLLASFKPPAITVTAANPVTFSSSLNSANRAEAATPGFASCDSTRKLWKEHILGAAALLTAKSDDNAAVQVASDKWYANADYIAAFLDSADLANWPLYTFMAAMKAHLDQRPAEAVDHLKGNYTADIADYDMAHEHILMMADTLSTGIINQFPAPFGGPDSAPRAGMPRIGEPDRPGVGVITWLFASASAGLLLIGGGYLFLRRRS